MLFAALDEIECTFKIVAGDYDAGRIRFTSDGADLSELMPEEAALIERHKHRVRIADALDTVRERREEEKREYQELLANDALYRAGQGRGRRGGAVGE